MNFQKALWTPASVNRNEITKQFEPIQPFFLLALARRLRCETLLDIGANVGAYSILFAEMRVHAFEPAPDAYRELVSNIQLNGLSGRITAHQIAVSDRRGKATFGMVDELSGRNSIAATSIHADFNAEIEVTTAPLDDLLNLSMERVCIKLDIEGHEPAALAGMAKLLTSNNILLQVEEWGDHDLPGLLAAVGLKRLCRIGHDHYFTNIGCEPETLVEAFEEASERLIESNLAPKPPPKPVREIRLLPGVSVRLTGKVGRLLAHSPDAKP
jgi:FkbM family methyltransferase